MALLRVFAAVLAVSSLWAQDAARVEIFGGYAYARADLGPEIGRRNLSGWDASATFRVNRSAGLTARVVADSGVATLNGYGLHTRIHALLFGPRIAERTHGRYIPFAYVQAGAAWIRGTLDAFPDAAASDRTFAAVMGGGLDVECGRFAVRAFQGEWFLTRSPLFLRDTQEHFRLSTGFVFRLGRNRTAASH
jgi:hypothetical protein